MHFQNSKLGFFTNNASCGHFHQVSINLITISYRYNKSYLPLSFSKYNETNQKLVYSYETSGTVMHATDFDAKCNVLLLAMFQVVNNVVNT